MGINKGPGAEGGHSVCEGLLEVDKAAGTPKDREIKKPESESFLEISTEYFFAAFPFKDLTNEVKRQVLLVDSTASSVEGKKSSETFSPLVLAFRNFLETFREVITKTYHDDETGVEAVGGFLEDIDQKLSALSKELKAADKDAKLHDFREHLHNLVSKVIFERPVYEDFLRRLKEETSGDLPAVPFLVVKSKEDFFGVRALASMQERTKHLVIGGDVPVEFLEQGGNLRLKPGDFARVRAILPPGYFGREFSGLDSRLQAGAAAEAMMRNQMAALTFLNSPVERSSAGQLGLSLAIPALDSHSFQIGADGSVVFQLALLNSNATRDLVFDTGIVHPSFRLFVSPGNFLTDEALMKAAQETIGSSFDPNIHIARQAGRGVALRIPVAQYAVQESGKEISVSGFLAGSGLRERRGELDSLLGISGWTDKVSDLKPEPGISMVLGQTPRVTFPKHVAGVISQTILVEHRGEAGSTVRHGGARFVAAEYTDNVRAEFNVRLEKGAEIGEQYLIIYLYPVQEKENN